MRRTLAIVAALTVALIPGLQLGSVGSPGGVFFSDNFDIANFSYDINQEYNAGTRQRGLLAPMTWSNRPEHNPGGPDVGGVVLHHPWCQSTLEFFVSDQTWPDYYGGFYHNYAWASPNHSFTESMRLDIEYDVDPIGPSSSGDPTNHFAAIVFGAGVQGPYAIPTSGDYLTGTSPGMSFWIQDGGGWSVQEDSAKIASGAVPVPKPGADQFYHVSLLIRSAGFGTGSDAHVSISVDDRCVYSGVRKGGFAGNYITLSALGIATSSYQMSQFDNFVVSELPEPTAIEVAAEKKSRDGDSVSVTAYVTAKFGNFFYIGTEDRSSGIRVEASDAGLELGRQVNVEGIMSTLWTGERVIARAFPAALSATREVAPLGMTNSSVGGGNQSYNPGPPPSGQQGVQDGVGLNNIGLLVRTTGKVIGSSADGSRWTTTITDGSGSGLHVQLPEGSLPPPVGSHVVVTGISSCENAGAILPRLLVSRAEDLREIEIEVDNMVRRLLIDDTFIESYHNLTRRLHPLVQYPGNPIIIQDLPWECHPSFRYYPSIVMWSNPVLRDPVTGKFRMWYSAYCDKDPLGRDTELLLYAESYDGISWTKPNLGLVEWNGSTQNNIVMAGITDDIGGARFLDTPNIIYRPDDPDPNSRFMMFAAAWTGNGLTEGVWVYRSPDGFQWEMLKGDAVPNAREFNSFFWDPLQGKFIGSVRIREPMLPRHVGHSESLDGINWGATDIILAPENLNTPYNLAGDDVYGLIGFRYQSHCIGFLHAHHTDRRLEVQMMSSMDGHHWDFVGNGQYILPNDPPGGYGQGMMSTQCGEPIRVGDELWIYIGIAPAAHTNPAIQPGPGQQKRAIGLAKIRVDGFVSMAADAAGGTLVTKPFVTRLPRLFVNADATGGSVVAEVLDSEGQPIAGLTAAECIPIVADKVAQELRWSSGAGIPTDRAIKVRFLLQNASIYSFWSSE